MNWHGSSVFSHEWRPKPCSRTGLVETPLLQLGAQMLHQALPAPLMLVLKESTRTAKLPLDTAPLSPEWILENAFSRKASMVKSSRVHQISEPRVHVCYWYGG